MSNEAQTKGKFSLPTRILIGLVLGALVGISLNLAFAPAAGQPASEAYGHAVWFADNVAQPAGQVFLRLLFMVVVPLVFCSLVLGITGLGDLTKLGRLGRGTIGWFLATTLLAVLIGLFMVNAIEPGKSMSPETVAAVKTQFSTDAQAKIDQGAAGTGFSIHTFVNIIPRNVIASAGNERDALGLIFFALMMGIAASTLGPDRTKAFREVLETVYECCVKILGYAMRIAPYGVFGLIYSVTAKLGLEVLQSLMVYVGVAMAGLLIHQFVVLPLLALVFAGVGPLRLLRGCRSLLVTAF